MYGEAGRSSFARKESRWAFMVAASGEDSMACKAGEVELSTSLSPVFSFRSPSFRSATALRPLPPAVVAPSVAPVFASTRKGCAFDRREKVAKAAKEVALQPRMGRGGKEGSPRGRADTDWLFC